MTSNQCGHRGAATTKYAKREACHMGGCQQPTPALVERLVQRGRRDALSKVACISGEERRVKNSRTVATIAARIKDACGAFLGSPTLLRIVRIYVWVAFLAVVVFIVWIGWGHWHELLPGRGARGL
jgi:hypothetical protein